MPESVTHADALLRRGWEVAMGHSGYYWVLFDGDTTPVPAYCTYDDDGDRVILLGGKPSTLPRFWLRIVEPAMDHFKPSGTGMHWLDHIGNLMIPSLVHCDLEQRLVTTFTGHVFTLSHLRDARWKAEPAPVLPTDPAPMEF